MDRYEKALADSKVTGDDSVVAAEVKKILESAGDYATPEVYQFLFSSIDLTTCFLLQLSCLEPFISE